MRQTSNGAAADPAAEVLGARAAVRRRRRRRRVAVVGWLVAALVVSGGGVAYGLFTAPVDFTEPPPAKSALLLDAQGRLLATVRATERREPVTTDQIPAVMRQAVIAVEDVRFFSHDGVDATAIARAAYNDLTGGELQGGSTITQQYVKNVFVRSSERTILRKVREAALAVRLERQLDKDEILTRYLNDLYLGQGLYGVQAASRYYFGADVQQISLAQAAMLAGVIPAPSLYNPVRDFERARERQLLTLNRMVTAGFISPQEASEAYREPPVIVQQVADDDLPTIAPEFRDLVRARLERELAEGRSAADADELLFRGGLRVTTTLDLDLQAAVVQALGEVLDAPDDPEAAVVAIDPRNGDIKAMTTRFDAVVEGERVQGYAEGGFNLATQARRSSGSTIKPFTLAAALMAGRTVDERVFAPACASIPNPGGTPDPYEPCNAEPSERGTYTLAKAMELSINTIYAPLAVETGMQAVMDVAGAAGLRPEENLRVNLANSLGVDVTPLSMAGAYSTLVNHGVRHEPRTLLEVRVGGDGGASDGDLVLSEPAAPEGEQVLPVEVADTVTDVLAGVVERGTGTAARQEFPVYAKTGTNGESDAWFVGCTRELCLATWMGYDDNRSMNGVQGREQVYGGTLPADVFARSLEIYRGLTAAAPAAERLDLGAAPSASVAPTRRAPAPLPSVAPEPVAPSPEAPSPAPSRTPSSSAPAVVPLPTRSPSPPPSPPPSAPPPPPPSSSPTPSPSESEVLPIP